MLVSDYDKLTPYELMTEPRMLSPDDRDMPGDSLGSLGSLKSTLGTVATIGLTSVLAAYAPQTSYAPQAPYTPTYTVAGTGEVRSPHYVSGPNMLQGQAQYSGANVNQMSQYQPPTSGLFDQIMMSPYLPWVGAGVVALVIYKMVR